METEGPSEQIIRFGVYEVDLRAGEVLKNGSRIKLQEKPFQVLALLLERPGEVITREQLRQRLWPDVNVDFEHSLSTAIKKLRDALDDSADTPRFIETRPGRGYRFIYPVETKEEVSPAQTRFRPLWLAGLATVVLLAAAASYFFLAAPALTESDYILLTDFVNTTGDPVFDGTLKQALAVKLGESPFLNVFPERKVQETLPLMNLSPDEPVTLAVARDICQREDIKAILTGAIASLGSQYVITLNAEDCLSGDSLAREQVEAAGKEKVLAAFDGATSSLRGKLGESLSSIQKLDTPLEQATTSSLEALRALTLGDVLRGKGKVRESIPFFKRAIELDPDFALAYARLGNQYSQSGQSELAREARTKAFELRGRVSEKERFYIEGQYFSFVTGEIEKSIEAYESWTHTYPRDWVPYNNLSGQYGAVGQLAKALQAAQEALRLHTDSWHPYASAAGALQQLNRFDEAKEVLERGLAHLGEWEYAHTRLYTIAFLRSDREAMQRHLAALKGTNAEPRSWSLQSQTAAFSGKLEEARKLNQRVVDDAQRRNLASFAAGFASAQAWLEAEFGNRQRASEQATIALDMARNGRTLLNAASALAGSGHPDRAETLLDELGQQFPTNTLFQAVTLPTWQAVLETQRGNPASAIELLQSAAPYERGSLAPIYYRGHAYLALGEGAEAAAEFQKILDRRGINPLSILHPLARLGLARAYTLAGDTTRSRKHYQVFLTLWKEADPDIPILQEAQAEYARLQESEASVPAN